MLTPQDFKNVFKCGVRQKKRGVIFIHSENDLPYARLGLAIAKRWLPLAVDRNRLRRTIREGFRQYQAQLAGMDVVVTISQLAQIGQRQIVQEELREQWETLVRLSKKACCVS